MTTTSKSPKTQPTWNLADIYKSISDPQCQKDIAQASKQAETFASTYKGTIKATVDAKTLLKAITEYEAILGKAVKPALYAELVFSGDSLSPRHGAFLQKMKAEYLKAYQHMIFFELEIGEIETKKLTSLTNDPVLINYRHYLEKILIAKPHRLSEPEEKLMNDKDLTGGSAFSRLFDEEFSNQKFSVTLNGKIKSMSETAVLDLLHSHDRDERKAGATGFTQGLKDQSRRLAYIYNMIGEDKAVNDRYSHFDNPESARHMSNEIDQAIVDAMTSVVTKSYPLVHKFYTFKRKLLGLKELYDYDRYAPLTKPKTKIPYEKAKAMVLDAYSRFSPDYAERAKTFFDKNWIDYGLRDGKRSGAFCMGTTPDLHPYILMNYGGTIDDVRTLAHELGHGVHDMFMRKQTLLNFDTPLTMAETSSVFGEMLLFDAMKEQTKSRDEKLALYTSKIESIFATVFRQIAMHKFEQDFHKARQEKGELAPEDINKLWRKRQQEMFGTSITLTPDYDLWWSYIPHFIHTPFYVYAYAFGELLTMSLYVQFKHDGPQFADKYVQLLSAGGSQSPQELLKPLGIDLTDKKFWQNGITMIKDLVEEAIAL